jgi:hypothetical protein
MYTRSVLLLILTTVGCSDASKIPRPGQSSTSTTRSGTADSNKDSDKALIKEVGSETNSVTLDPNGSQLQWSKTTFGDEPISSTGGPTDEQFQISEVIPVSQEPESSRNYRYLIRGRAGATGTVNLSVQLDELAGIDPAKEISMIIGPDIVALDGIKEQQITLNVKYSSPTESVLKIGSKATFRLIAQVKDGQKKELTIPLSVSSCETGAGTFARGCTSRNWTP